MKRDKRSGTGPLRLHGVDSVNGKPQRAWINLAGPEGAVLHTGSMHGAHDGNDDHNHQAAAADHNDDQDVRRHGLGVVRGGSRWRVGSRGCC